MLTRRRPLPLCRRTAVQWLCLLLASGLWGCGPNDDEVALMRHWRVIDDSYQLPDNHLPEHDELVVVTEGFVKQLRQDGQLILRQNHSYTFITGADTSQGTWAYERGYLALDEPYGDRLLFEILNVDPLRLDLKLHQRRGSIPFDIYITLQVADSVQAPAATTPPAAVPPQA